MSKMVSAQTCLQKDTTQGIGLALAGVFVLSFDALLIRLAMAGSWDILFWRGLLMGLSLGLLSFCRTGCFFVSRMYAQGCASFVSGTLFGLSGAGFVLSIMHTHVANTAQYKGQAIYKQPSFCY